MQLKDFPRPRDDNGTGIHLFPHPYMTGDALDPWIAKMVAMKMKWVTMLNTDSASIRKFAAAGIQPVSRPFFRANQDWGDDSAVVESMLAAGVGPYVQIYNEPELTVEWPGSTVDENAYIGRWISAAERIYARGGLPGIQLLDPDWLRDLLNAIKSAGMQYLFDKIWYSCHNYTSNHPPSYPYDSLNAGKTIYDDWFAMLAPLKFDKVFRDTIGRSVPVICGEGGWCIGDNADNRYPRIGYDQHRDFHVVMFDMFRTGTMPNGERLPDWWFAVTPWILASQLAGGPQEFEENAWYSDNLSGTKTLTIAAVKAMPQFVRQFGGQRQEPRQSTIRGTVTNGTPGQTVLLSGRSAASTKTDIRNRFAFTRLLGGAYTVELQGANVRLAGIRVNGTGTAVISLSATPLVWTGRIVSNTSGTVPRGSSSILRVSVIGLKDLLVRISAWSITLTNKTGTKPEYGEYACEFAPLPAGTWIVEPDGVGAKLGVPLDGVGVAVVEFTKAAEVAAPASDSVIRGALVNGKSGTKITLKRAAASETLTLKGDRSYQFTDLPAGIYSLEAEGTGAKVEDIGLDGTNQVVVNLVVGSAPGGKKESEITGRVSAVVVGAGVELILDGQRVATTTVQSEGTYRFAGLSAGTYTVGLLGTKARRGSVTVDGLNKVTLDLTAPEPTNKVLYHYVLFWQAEQDWAKEDWAGAVGYIARFRPTAGFALEDAGYARYVTIIGGINGISEETESGIRWLGAKVERVAGKDSDETATILNDMAAKGRRFLTLDERKDGPEPN